MVRACVQPDPLDTFQVLPVFDKATNISYKNCFCATCNQAKEIVFWQTRLRCDNVHYTNHKEINWVTFLQRHCNKQKHSWAFSPPNNTMPECCALRKYCGWLKEANRNKQANDETIKDLCEAYYLPVCQQLPSSGSKIFYNNPHCLQSAIHSGSSIIDLHCLCRANPPITIPGIQILFDFSSTSQFTVNVGSQKIIMVTDHSSKHQVYDPFSRSCRNLALKTYINNSTSNTTLTISTSNVTLTSNCVQVSFTNEEIKLFPNESVYIKPHNRIYPNNIYTSTRSGVMICTNFLQNYTKTNEKLKDDKKKYPFLGPSPHQVRGRCSSNP